MALRELLIKLTVRADATQLEATNKRLSETAATAEGLSQILGKPVSVAGLTGAGNAAEALGAKMRAVAPSIQTIAAKAQTVGATVRASMASGFAQTPTQAARASTGVGRAFDSIRAGAARVSVVAGTVLDPIRETASRTLTVLQRWGQQVADVSRRAAEAVRRTAAIPPRAPKATPSAVGGGGGPGILGSVIGGAVGGALVLGTQKLKQYAASALETAGSINDLRAATGVSAKAIQTWTPILTQAGASEGDFRKGLISLNKTLQAAGAGGKEAQKSFAALGLDYKALQGVPLEEVWAQTSKALAGTANESDRLNLATKVLGKSGANLAPAFAEGNAALDEQVKKFGELNVTMSETDVTRLDAAGDSIDTLKLGLAKIGPTALLAFLPLIETVTNTLLPLLPSLLAAITPIIQALADGLAPVIKAVLPAFAAGMQAVAPILQALAPLFGDVVTQLVGALLPAALMLVSAFGEVFTAIAPLVPVLVGALLPVIPVLAEAITGLVKGFAPLVATVLPIFIRLVSAIVPVIAAIIPQFAEFATSILAAVMPAVEQLLPALVSIFEAVLPLVPVLVSALLPALLALVPPLVQLALAFVPLIQTLLPVLIGILAMLIPGISMLADILGGVLTGTINVVTASLSALTGTLRVIVTAFQLVWAAVMGGPDALNQTSAAFGAALDQWWGAIVGFGKSILGFFTGIWDSIIGGFQRAVGVAADLLSAVGIGDGASLQVNATAAQANIARAPALDAYSSKTENKNVTLQDNRQMTMKFEHNASSSEVAQGAMSYADKLLATDRQAVTQNIVGAR